MSAPTLPQPAADGPPDKRPPFNGVDTSTDKGLRQALGVVQRAGSWEQPTGQRLLAETRRRAVRNAAHLATATGAPMGRGLVDDVLLAAWLVMLRHSDRCSLQRAPGRT